MENFVYDIPTKIYFGKREIENLGKLILQYGKKVLFLYGKSSIKKIGLYDEVINKLKQNNISYCELSGVDPNPRLSTVREGIEIVKKNGIDFILCVGGGSTIDCGKAIAAGAKYSGDVWDFYSRKAFVKEALPIGAVLTLAATGSEMNGNSVITNVETQEKLGTGSYELNPKFSILDPEYTYSVNEYQTAAGIADIMSHIFEQYFSPTKNTYVQDRMAESLLKTCIKYAPIAIKEPNNYEARSNIMWASTLALNGLIGMGKIGDWACHGIEHEVSAIYDVTHGIGLGVITPNWMKYVLDDSTVDKFHNYGKNVFGIEGSEKMEIAKQSIERTREFFSYIGVPINLRKLKVEENSLKIMAKKSVQFGELGNIKKLNMEDVFEILKMSY